MSARSLTVAQVRAAYAATGLGPISSQFFRSESDQWGAYPAPITHACAIGAVAVARKWAPSVIKSSSARERVGDIARQRADKAWGVVYVSGFLNGFDGGRRPKFSQSRLTQASGRGWRDGRRARRAVMGGGTR